MAVVAVEAPPPPAADGGDVDQNDTKARTTTTDDVKESDSAHKGSADTSYGLKDMWAAYPMRQCLIMFTICCIVNTSFTEVLPLLAILPISEGGMGLNARPIGIIFMILAIEAVFTNMMFPHVVKRVSRRLLLQFTVLLWGLSIAFTPLLTLKPLVGDTIRSVALTSAYLSIRTAVSTWAFTVLSMGIADNAPKRHLGTATSIEHAFANVFRAFIPPFSTILFAWSVRSTEPNSITTALTAAPPTLLSVSTTSPRSIPSQHPFPFDKWLCFFVLGGLMLFNLYLQRHLTEASYQRPVDESSATIVVASPNVTDRGRFPNASTDEVTLTAVDSDDQAQ